MEAEENGPAEGGYTLVEVLMAISLLMVGMLAVGMLQHAAASAISRSGGNTEAIHIAEHQLEEIIHMPYSDPRIMDVNRGNNGDLAGEAISLKPGGKPLAADHYFTVDSDGGMDPRGKYTVIINVAESTPIADTRTVVVAVVWNGGRCILRCVKSLAR